jgi:hypothetical protein
MARVHRRSLLIAAGAFPATLLSAEVVHTSGVPRIGYLAPDFANNLRLFEAFRDCVILVMLRAATS